MTAYRAEPRSATPSTGGRLSQGASVLPISQPAALGAVTQEAPEQREISLMAGETYLFDVLDSTSTPGTWSALFGRCSKSGIYTAPRYMPQESDDSISYSSASGEIIEINFHIRPNPSRPETNQPRYLRATGRTVNRDGVEVPEYNLIGGLHQMVLDSGDLLDVTPGDGTSIAVLEVGDEYLPPRHVKNCVDLVPISPKSGTVLVPAEAVSGTSEIAVTVNAISQNVTIKIAGTPTLIDKKVKSCAIRPRNPLPEEPH